MSNLAYLGKTLVLLIGILISTPAYAYLDPGTGSILLQGLLGGLAGAAVFLKLYWHKLLSLFGRKKSDDTNENQD